MLYTQSVYHQVGREPFRIDILHDINITFETSEMVAIMGPSGCGKSTLLGILAGLDSPTSGAVMLDAQDVYKLPNDRRDQFRNENFGVVFQSQNLVKELTCFENVCVPLIFSKKRVSQKDRDRARELLSWVGLEGKEKLYPYQMSGGEQQRTAIARALVKRPKVLFADEPTGALDQENSRNVLRIFRQSIELNHHLIVLVTHDPSVAKLCDRIIRMSDGRLVER